MEVVKVFAKVKELGHINSRREELRDYCKLKLDQITKFLPTRILNADGGDLLDCLLNGLPDQPTSSCKSKVKIIDIVLLAMRQESTSLTHCSDVVNRLCLEFSRMPAEDLVRWCGDSVQSIVEDKDVNMIWKDVLPECLSALSCYSQVRHCGTDMTPAEYKEQCVRTLCQCQWREGQLVQLSAMFKDMQISRADHKQVVNKLCSYIMDVPPDTLPPLVHQMMKLCKSYDMELVLGQLARYFGARLYSKLEPPPNDSESTTMDIDEFVSYSPAEISSCLSTCIYHVTQGAADPELVRRHLKNWPRAQLLRSPFLIDLALALTEKGADFKSTCLDIIKSAIEQRVVEAQKSAESAWIRSVLPPDVDVPSVLKVLTTESGNHRQLTVLGLIHLGFALLASRGPAAGACWSLGQLVLVRLCRLQAEAAPRVAGLLADRLAGELAAPRQYADCLYVLCKLTPQSIERCSELSTILESCQPAGAWRGAAAVLRAVRPLLAGGARARDTLLLQCRKGLYSRDSAHRCLALSGFLCVLRYARLARTSASQAASEQHSAHSYLTQLTVDLHCTQRGSVASKVRNEAICMEVVSILRRCLVQDAAVKQLLYLSIYDCASDKPVLHEPIIELLYEHLLKFIPDEGDASLLIDKCVLTTPLTAVLNEPIACLLYAIAQFLQPAPDEELEDILQSQGLEPGGTFLKNKLQTLLNKLCSGPALARVDLEDPGLTDLTPESKAKSLKVQQTLQCYEALVAHQVMQWSAASTDVAATVYELFRMYTQLLDQAKVPLKIGKKGSKTSLNDTKEAKSQKSQKSQKENAKGKGPVKLSNLVKDRAPPFKPLPCVWDLSFCLRVLELLYSEDLPWSTVEQRNSIRSRRDFHHFALKCTQSVMADENLDKQDIAKYCVKIAALMYSRCLCRYQDMCDFDDQSALLCLDVFRECLTMIFSPNYGLKLEGLLATITGETEATSEASLALILEQLLSCLSRSEDESETDCDAQSRKALMLIASLLLEKVEGRQGLSEVVLKFEDFARTSKFDCVPLLPALLAANCSVHQDARLLDELLERLTQALGKIDEEDTSGVQETELFSYIDERSGHTVLAQICTHLICRISHAELLVNRAKQLDAAAGNTQLKVDAELGALTPALLLQLCQLARWAGRGAALRCCVGAGSERVLQLLVRLYAALSALVRRVTPPEAAQHSGRLERLLKLSGKKLSSLTDTLITYLEASSSGGGAGGGGAGRGRVLRDTRLIPRLVLRAEQLSRHVLLLGQRSGTNYQQYLSLGTARDFRIKAPVLQEVLQALDQRDESRDDEEADINDAETTLLSNHSDEERGAAGDTRAAGGAGGKRRRKS